MRGFLSRAGATVSRGVRAVGARWAICSAVQVAPAVAAPAVAAADKAFL